MIAYHGGPFSDLTIAAGIWRKHHAMISCARNEQIGIAAEYAPSFTLDNGAFSLWRAGQRRLAWESYYRWVEVWRNYPGFDFAMIPDVIDGSEEENDDLLAEWPFDGVLVLSPPRVPGQACEARKQLFANSTGIERSVSLHLHAAVVGPDAANHDDAVRRG